MENLNKNNNMPSWAVILITSIISIVLSFVVSFFTAFTQNNIQQQSINRDYVQIAVSILQDPKANSDLKIWATSLINKESPVLFNNNLFNNLGTGKILFPSTNFFLNSNSTDKLNLDNSIYYPNLLPLLK